MTTVEQALELLLDVVHGAMVEAQEQVAEALAEQEFEAAQAALDRARDLKALETQVDAVEKELARLIASESVPDKSLNTVVDDEAENGMAARRYYGRMRRGLKTPEAAYMRPILEVLVELGGSGRIKDVMERVYARMEDQLNDHDHTRLPSNGMLRWRNTAQWARNLLREDGRIRDDSPHGVWAISEAGRAWLTKDEG